MWLRLCLVVFVLAVPSLFPQTVQLRPAHLVEMPAQVDSNSPVYWYNGEFRILNSNGTPVVTGGRDQFYTHWSKHVDTNVDTHRPMWIEAAWLDEDGTLYAWYHHEPAPVCTNVNLTAPKIGALISYDGGKSFLDLGPVLTSGDPVNCNSKNGFFASGHGDFSVILDREKEYFYFYFSSYGGSESGQGVGVARMAFEDRMSPVGAVWKYYRGEWEEPGIGGRLTPALPVARGWQHADTNAFWGPSLHWNTYLESYVMLLNYTCCRPLWPQAGIYVSFNVDVSKPNGWSTPRRIMAKPPSYYPQILGVNEGETDTVAGQLTRFFIQGRSFWELVFSKSDVWENEPDESEYWGFVP